MLVFLFLSAGGGLLVLWLCALLSQRERRGREPLADTVDEAMARELQERLQLERELADRYYDCAFAARESGALEEAERFLDLALNATDKSARTLTQLLAVMAVLWPTVGKGTAVRAPRRERFRLASLARLATIEHILHRLLFNTPAAGQRLRLYGLRLRLTVATLFLRDARRTIGGRRWNAGRHFDTIRELAEDLPAVFREALEILAALLGHLPPRLSRWTDLRDAWRRRPEATAMTLRVALFFVLLLAWHLVRLSRPM